MFNRKSSYALNKKDPNAIVYMDANEAIIRLTREDFASEKEFLKWKALSDEDYHASEKEAHVYANHTLALDELSEEAASIPAVDVCMEQAHDRAEAIHRSVRKVTQIRKHLTDTQFRRVWMRKRAMRTRLTVSGRPPPSSASCRTKPIPERWYRANRVRHTTRSSRWSSVPPPSGCVSRMPTKR